ncbi:RNA-binding protein [Amaricoccus macauensis]|uniref:RNA-binding protein n=1 Tax=Amaricoccus macauensis TaxID=57001 RepID=UPI003C7C806C
MTRGRSQKDHAGTERRCIVSRETRPKSGLIRFVLAPDGQVAPDLASRLPGRGVYVAPERELLRRAVDKSFFSRAFKQKAEVSPELPELVERLLSRRLVDLVAMARKAGEAVCGFQTVLETLKSGKAVLLVQASDGSAREKAELRPPKGPENRISCLSASELGMAFGRDRVIHGAVLAGGLSDRIKQDALRLDEFRGERNRQVFGDEAGEGLAGEGLREKG